MTKIVREIIRASAEKSKEEAENVPENNHKDIKTTEIALAASIATIRVVNDLTDGVDLKHAVVSRYEHKHITID